MKKQTIVIILLAVLVISCLALTACTGTAGPIGPQGEQGIQGPQGQPGQDGTDGITPQLKIGADNYWYVSYDNGKTWTSLGVKATGGDSVVEHTWEKIQTLSRADCVNDGQELHACKDCGTAKLVTIKSHGCHDIIHHSGKQATCIGIGWDAYETCSRCDYSTYSQIPAYDHNLRGGVCTVCGNKPSFTLGFTLSEDGTYYIVSGMGTCTDTDIVIPSIYNNKPVSAIKQQAFVGNSSKPNYAQNNIKSVTIPGSVKSINLMAFCNLPNLTTINICEGVESIGIGAFYGCTGLKTVEIPSTVSSVSGVFANCTSLTSIIVDKSNTNYKSIDGSIYTKDGTTLVQYALGKTDATFTIPTGVTTIGDYAFMGCTNLANIAIPNSVTVISNRAFYGCSNLTNITIPSSVTTIGECAFYGCSNLASVALSTGVKTIGNSAFSGCTSLSSITIPSSVISIGTDVFYNCTGLHTINVDERNASYKSVDGNLYTKDGKTMLLYAQGKTNSAFTVPNGVQYIANRVFYNCKNLVSITIPNSVAVICDYAFYGCSNIIGVALSTGVITIGDYAFYGCTNLANIAIPSSVITIGKYAFRGCSNLVSVALSTGVTTIGDYAFYDCSSLASITIPSSVITIGDHAFYGCANLSNITIPSSVTSIGRYAFYNCSSLTSATFADPKGWYVTSTEGATYGNSLTLNNAAQNATYLNDSYYWNYWYKKTN